MREKFVRGLRMSMGSSTSTSAMEPLRRIQAAMPGLLPSGNLLMIGDGAESTVKSSPAGRASDRARLEVEEVLSGFRGGRRLGVTDLARIRSAAQIETVKEFKEEPYPEGHSFPGPKRLIAADAAGEVVQMIPG